MAGYAFQKDKRRLITKFTWIPLGVFGCTSGHTGQGTYRVSHIPPQPHSTTTTTSGAIAGPIKVPFLIPHHFNRLLLYNLLPGRSIIGSPGAVSGLRHERTTDLHPACSTIRLPICDLMMGGGGIIFHVSICQLSPRGCIF